MNIEFQKKDRCKQRFIFEDHNDFIKREPVKNEELEITPIIDLDAVKTEQDEPNQSEKDDLKFPIETQLNFPVENQANVLKTYAHYTTSTSKNSDNLTVPELIENSLPNETQPVDIKIEKIEQIVIKEHITFEPTADKVDVKQNIIFEPFEKIDIEENIVKNEESVVKQPLGIEDVTDSLINVKSALPKTAQKPRRKRFKYKCAFCVKKFTTKEKMNKHIRTHNGKKPSCRCAHRYLNIHVKTRGAPFACNLCKLVTCTRADLKRHVVKFHGMKSVVYECHHCQSGFPHKDHLIAHLKLQSDDYTSHYKCSNAKIQIINLSTA